MNDRLNEWRYGRLAVWLHWLCAALIVGLLGVGWYMMAIEDEPGSGWYFDQHKSFGLVLFALLLIRLCWRLTHKPAPLPASVPGWQRTISSLTQWLLYACMFAMPVIGFLGAAHTKRGVALFGAAFPAWFTPDHDVAEQFFDVHSGLAVIMTALIVLHVLAGLKHLLVDKDQVFRRIWF
ncbi:cytochrome b [Duganella vulcania]|uniref:Cytochrome b n=1 Tax=Duganella vulcania TaxID=2692166 RepID=A0A845H0W5_9BURK|nr:cytochrome b [Duganella vulcania]MYM98537.1 cytochrome b [Duganella vulcania]